MSPGQRLAVIENKLDLLCALLARLVPIEDIREVELEAQYIEALREVSVNPALLRKFVQNHPVWVAEHNRKSALPVPVLPSETA